MKRYQAIAFLLSTAMTVGSVAPVFGASSDVLGHWAEFSITKWQNEGRIGGYEDGTFKPDKPITRAEFVRFLNSAVSTPDGGSVSFSDVSTSDWFYNDVAKAVASKIASGFEDNTFRPSETVTRMQAAVFITNALKLTPNEAGANALTDAASIPAWAKGAVGAVISAGFMSGYPDGSFGGSKGMTRAEAVSTLDRVLGNGASTNTNQPTGEVDTTNRDEQKEDNKKEEEKNTGNMVWKSGGGGGSSKKHSSSNKNDKVDVTGVSLDKNTLELKEGESQQLVATVTPSDATNKDVTWTSSDETIATVDKDGNVTAVKEGSATITVTTTNKSKTDSCVVTVTAKEEEKPEPKPEPTPDPTPTPDPAPVAQLTPNENVNGLTADKKEAVDATTGVKTVTFDLKGTNIEPGVTDEIKTAGETFVFPNGISGADWFNTYAPEDFKDKFTLVTLQIPLEADAKGSLKLVQKNDALKDVFLIEDVNLDKANNQSQWDPSIKLENGTGTKTTVRNISKFNGAKVYDYIFMVEKGEDVTIETEWYAGDTTTQATKQPTSQTTYIIKSDGVTFKTIDPQQKAADEAKAVVLATNGRNKKGLEIISKTAKEGDTPVVNVTLGGTVQAGALTTDDGEQARVDEINGLFDSADWITENASDYAKSQGYFVMTLDIPVPDGYADANYASTHTNKTLWDFYLSKDGWTAPAGETWTKIESKDGKVTAKKSSNDSNKSAFEPLVGTNGARSVLPFAFLAIKGEPVTLEFTFKKAGSPDKTVKYVIDTSNVTVTGTDEGGEQPGEPTVVGQETAKGLPTAKVEPVDGKAETNITFDGKDKEVEGGTENADTQAFDDVFGDGAQDAIGASYEGQQLVLTTIEVPIEGLGETQTASTFAMTREAKVAQEIKMVQTNKALEGIKKYLSSDEDINGDVWTKVLSVPTDATTVKVPVLVDPKATEPVKLVFSKGTATDAPTSTYNIKMNNVSVAEAKGDTAVPAGEIIDGLSVTLEKGKSDNEYTLKVSSSKEIQAGLLSTAHGVTADVAEAYKVVFAAAGGQFENFFDKDYTQKDTGADGKEISYENGKLNDLVRSATMLQFTIPIPADATAMTIKQTSPLMEAYKKDTKHKKDTDGTWYKETTPAISSGVTTKNLAILASPEWKTGDSVIEVTFTVGGKEQKVTYTVDTSGLKTKAYTPTVVDPTQTTPDPAPTTPPTTPSTNTPQVDPSKGEEPSAGDDVQKEEPDAEENVAPPTTGEVTPPADDVTDKEQAPEAPKTEGEQAPTETKPEDEQGKQDAEQKPEEPTEPETNTGAEGEGNTDTTPEEQKEPTETTEPETGAEGEGNTDPAPEEQKVITEPTNSPFGEAGEM